MEPQDNLNDAAQVAEPTTLTPAAPEPTTSTSEPTTPDQESAALPPTPIQDEHPGRRWRAIRERLAQPTTLYWVVFALIFIAGTIPRMLRLDMPPVDFPADRQKSNCMMIDLFMRGGGLMSLRTAWREVPFYPWIVAHTAWLGRPWGLEIWTLARIWSVVFGLLTVALAALIGYRLAPSPVVSEGRRRRLSLLFMAAVAFNVYHIRLSRMITTEPLTLAAQAGALACFLAAHYKPRQWRNWVLFGLCFGLAGLGKIPSLVWLPAYLLYFAFNRQIPIRLRLTGLAVMGLGGLGVLWAYGLSPLTLVSSYSTKYSHFFNQSLGWMGSDQWNRAFIGRVVLMLMLPGVFFGLFGLLVAPRMFRLTLPLYLIFFYFLNNLNTYNFAHLILPGAALSACGIDLFFELAVRPPAWLGAPEHSAAAGNHWLRWSKYTAAALFVGLLGLTLYEMGPNRRLIPINSVPQADLLQAVRVIREQVPKEATVANNDGQAALSYLLQKELGRQDTPVEMKLNRHTKYYYSVRRFEPEVLDYAADSWVKWASLPGEPNGLLFSDRPTTVPATAGQGLSIGKNAREPGVTLDLEELIVPANHFDAAVQTIAAAPGDRLNLGVRWFNPQQAPLATLIMQGQEVGQMLPAPVREGGFALQRAAVLCLPAKAATPIFYTFEIPRNFPPGTYQLLCYPLARGKWDAKPDKLTPFPVRFTIKPGPVAGPVIAADYRELYPTIHDRAPVLWSDHLSFKNMKLQGMIYNMPVTHYLACTGSRPGLYRLTIDGSSIPITSATSPENMWVKVEVCLPGIPQPVASVDLASIENGRFSTEFRARAPFDMVMLRFDIKGALNGKFPFWMIDFNPDSYGILGQQYASLRAVELRREEMPVATGAKTK